jgi:hypothetical protein
VTDPGDPLAAAPAELDDPELDIDIDDDLAQELPLEADPADLVEQHRDAGPDDEDYPDG